MNPDLIKGIERSPAFSITELKEIIDNVFSTELSAQEYGLNLLNRWTEVKSDVIPAGISCTKFVLHAIVRDAKGSEDASYFFCTALTKFSNHIYNEGKGNFSIPLSSIARDLKVSTDMVDLRNMFNHTDILPDIMDLRVECQKAFEWLERNFWVPYYNNYKMVDNSVALQELEDTISEALTTYQESMIEFLQDQPNTLLRKNADAISFLKPLLPYLVKFQSKVTFIKMLCSAGQLLPPSLYLRELKSRSLEEENYLTTDTPELPLFVQNIWRPLLNLLNKKDLLSNFLVKLLKKQSKFCPLADRMIASWVVLILNYKRRPSYINNFRYPNWNALLKSSLRKPSDYTLSFLPLLFDKINPPYAESKIKAIYATITTYLGKYAESTEETKSKKKYQTAKMYTAEDLEYFQKAEYQKKHPDSNPFVLMNCYDDLSSIPEGVDIMSAPAEEEPAEEKEEALVDPPQQIEERDPDFLPVDTSSIVFRPAYIF